MDASYSVCLVKIIYNAEFEIYLILRFKNSGLTLLNNWHTQFAYSVLNYIFFAHDMLKHA